MLHNHSSTVNHKELLLLLLSVIRLHSSTDCIDTSTVARGVVSAKCARIHQPMSAQSPGRILNSQVRRRHKKASLQTAVTDYML